MYLHGQGSLKFNFTSRWATLNLLQNKSLQGLLEWAVRAQAAR